MIGTPLVRMRARPHPRNCWPCSWSTRTRRNCQRRSKILMNKAALVVTSKLDHSCGSVLGLRRFEVDHRRNASHFGRSTLDCTGKRFSNRKGNENMKTKLSAVALVASAVTIAQANPGGVPAAKGASPEAQLHAVPRRFTLRCGPAVFHRSARRRCGHTAVDRFIQANALPRLGCVRHHPSRTGGLSIRVEVRSRVPVHTR